jgi:hypothetical protein
MVPVIDAIAVARLSRDQEASLRPVKTRFRLESPAAVPKNQRARSETAEKLPFNIGRILVRQSRSPLLRAAGGKSCRRAEKAAASEPP